MSDDRTRRLGDPAGDPRAADAAAMVGRVVDDWTIVRLLAGGGFGTVYEARHVATGARAAIKLLHEHLVESAAVRARFEREAAVIARLRHPSVVELVAVGIAREGQPYLCMELLDGEDLEAYVAREGPLSPAAALAILEPLCAGLAAAHALGIVHRDLKPSNVIVCRPAPGADRGRVVLLDFGIAKLSDALGVQLTATHEQLGTPSCMAPEQIHGGTIDARTDVYALGGLAYFLLAGRPPFDDPSATMVQYLHLHARRPRVSSVVTLSPRLDEVIARAMAIDAAGRFADPMSMLGAFRAALRESATFSAVEAADAAAILVTATTRGAVASHEEALFADLEAVLPVAERALAAAGFTLGLDLGSSAVFVNHACAPAAAVGAALAAWDELERRPQRDPRVRVGLCVHRASATFVGSEIRSASLLQPGAWGISDELDGVWTTDGDGGRPARIH